LKNWLLGGTAAALVFLGLEVRSQMRTIEDLRSAVSRGGPSELVSPEPVQNPRPAAAPDQTELLALTEEVERYKAGLEKCVTALNATASAQRSEVRTFVIPGVSAPAREAADIIELTEPYVLPSGSQIVVSGKLYNRGNAPGVVTVAVTLFENGRRRETEYQRVSLAAGQDVGWQQPFRWDGHEAMWTAQVEVQP
jgi:hypothetical protein